MRTDCPKRLRCAIYTRKSSEEGLEQAFNSLDAQREACEAYIKSQAGEGWHLIPTHYDDGGVSGGTLDRPALQQLLSDITARKVDTIVVYKVDRLTRSLADFAKIVDVFDTHVVSFVSVTQQFNTTSSMGRLTLNMLLSFAQFEREVTGERIRDKIAASKKKGMWMGGFVPLGYDAKDRSLVINEPEAETVRTVFRLYLKHGTVRHAKDEADRRRLTTKVRPADDGPMRGGQPLSRGHIYRLLANPLYIGRIAHKGETYGGQHASIIDAETWSAVQATLAGNGHPRRSGARTAEPSLLAGLLYDERGNRLSPSHKVRSGKQYRYYISRNLITEAGSKDAVGFRIPAHEIETLVANSLARLLRGTTRLFDLLEMNRFTPDEAQTIFEHARHVANTLRTSRSKDGTPAFGGLPERVTVFDDRIEINVSTPKIRQMLGIKLDSAKSTGVLDDPARCLLTVPAKLRRFGGACKLIVADGTTNGPDKPDPALLKVLGHAHDWFHKLTTGQAESAAAIARETGLTRSYVTRVMRLAFLAPDITEAILSGRQPPDVTAERLVRRSRLPLAWDDQRRALGFTRLQ